jgi:hypothetical protein
MVKQTVIFAAENQCYLTISDQLVECRGNFARGADMLAIEAKAGGDTDNGGAVDQGFIEGIKGVALIENGIGMDGKFGGICPAIDALRGYQSEVGQAEISHGTANRADIATVKRFN